MTKKNPNCSCPNNKCPRHGICEDCVEFHKANDKKIPFCLRSISESK